MLGKADRVKTKMKRATKEAVELERYSEGPDGFRIRVAIDLSKRPEALKSGLNFVDSFLAKMPDFCVKIDTEEREAGAEKAEIVKNVGFAFGEGLRKLIEKRKAKDSGSSIHSDGKAMCMFAISAKRQPGEANLQIIGAPGRGFDPQHFFAFFDGLAQGMEAEVDVAADFGKSKEKQMDFVSRAFADALEQVFA